MSIRLNRFDSNDTKPGNIPFYFPSLHFEYCETHYMLYQTSCNLKVFWNEFKNKPFSRKLQIQSLADVLQNRCP